MAIDIRKQLVKLREAIQQVEMDAETRESVRRLDSDVHDLIDVNEVDVQTDSVLKRAAALEAKFSKKYPTVARIVGELLEAIAKTGS